MALSKFTKDMAIIAALDDEPNDVGGLSAQQLKEKFDEGGNALKEYLNNTLTAEADQKFATKEEVQGITLGQIPAGTITADKLAEPIAHSVILSAVDFTEGIWTAVETDDAASGYTLTISASAHGRQSANFICSVWHLVNGAYRRNTWAAQTTDIHYDTSTGNIVLSSETAYAGKVTFMG